MPTELQDLHPVVKTFPDESGRLRMGASLRQHGLLYLHGLPQETVRRGYVVREQPIAPEHRRRITTSGQPGAKDHFRGSELNIVIDGFSYLITINQQHPKPRTTSGTTNSTSEHVVPAIPATVRREKDDCQARWQAADEAARLTSHDRPVPSWDNSQSWRPPHPPIDQVNPGAEPHMTCEP